MSRALTIGNGNLLVGIDHRGQVRDFYFPYVGHANHVSGASGNYTHRVGVWIDGALSWLSDTTWNITFEEDARLITQIITAYNRELEITLVIRDVVHNEHNVFLRRIEVRNEKNVERTIKVFFGQEFRISESRRGDTAFYDPRVQSIIHYKGHDAFLVHASLEDVPFDDYSVGLFGIEGKEGSYLDAGDGTLTKNPIEHGSVDSVIGLSHTYAARTSATIYYWIVAGGSLNEVHTLQNTVLTETPKRLMDSAIEYWHAWIHKESRNFSLIEKSLQVLYEHSLLVIRMHMDNRGGIIASSDTDMLNQGRDTYGYVWPRDAAMSINALDRAGYRDSTEKSFMFLAKLLEPDGYLMHKYRVDGMLGSSWHPWIRDGEFELPIQEDETALPIYMLAQHYEYAHDLEFIESLYNPFIEPAADFMCRHIEEETGLPAHSYDLWEEKFGTSTFTASAVYGALTGAASISALLGKRENAEKYRAHAYSIRQAILTYLFDIESQTFVKLIRHEGGKVVHDKTLDMSSLYGIVQFEVLDPYDARVKHMVKAVEQRLKVQTDYGGYMRYEGDQYYMTNKNASPNAWCITTLWLAQYYIKAARTKKELQQAYDMLLWTKDRTSSSGMLPEQINPITGEHLSTTPLVWSHAEYVITVDEYIKKYKSLN
jgi:oligosaccharide amylase